MRNEAEQYVIEEAPRPPAAPEPGRSIRFSRLQAATLLVLGVIVVSALAGAAGDGEEDARVTTRDLDVQIHYTTRLRLQKTELLSVLVRNRTTSPIARVRLDVDTSYMKGFGEASVVPPALYPYVMELTALPPGGYGEIQIEARGVRAGMHRGDLLITTARDTARVALSTFILP